METTFDSKSFQIFQHPIETTLKNIDELIDSKKAQEGVDAKKLMKVCIMKFFSKRTKSSKLPASY